MKPFERADLVKVEFQGSDLKFKRAGARKQLRAANIAATMRQGDDDRPALSNDVLMEIQGDLSAHLVEIDGQARTLSVDDVDRYLGLMETTNLWLLWFYASGVTPEEKKDSPA